MIPTHEQLINSPRETSAEYHILSARSWRQTGESKRLHTPLVYAAFEYRCAIERTAVELYATMRDDIEGADDMSKIGSFGALLSRIREIGGGNEKLLQRTLIFNRIVAEFAPLEKPLAMPSPSKLHDFWTKLSAYCHRQLHPGKTWELPEWVERGYGLLDEVDCYLVFLYVEHSFGAVPTSSLQPEVKQTKIDFLTERIDENQLRLRLKIMAPVLEDRLKSKRAT